MLTEEQIEEYRTKYGRIAHVVGRGGAWEAVFRKPTRAEVRKFRSDCHNPAAQPFANESLCRTIAVYPPAGVGPNGFEALLDEWPMVPEAASGALSELLGLATEELGK